MTPPKTYTVKVETYIDVEATSNKAALAEAESTLHVIKGATIAVFDAEQTAGLTESAKSLRFRATKAMVQR